MKCVVRDIRRSDEANGYEVDLTVDGEKHTFTLFVARGGGGCSVADDEGEAFDRLFWDNMLIPGEIADLVGDVHAGASVKLPVELGGAGPLPNT